MSTKTNPVVFIHGLWIHSTAWQPWLDLFTERGYRVSAPGWPGDGETVAATRANPEALDDVGIRTIVDHYASVIGSADGRHEAKPIAVGHSFGGLIAQELLAAGLVAAAVAIDPAPIKGVKALPLAQLRSAFPVLSNPANRHRTVSLNLRQFRYAFGNALSVEESNRLHELWTIPGPGLPLFEAATANLSKNSPARVDTRLVDRGPLLLTSGTEDHTVPLKVTKEVFGMYAKGVSDTPVNGVSDTPVNGVSDTPVNGVSDTDFHVFPGRGHSLTIDHGWRDVAEVALDWFAAKGF
ncbi:alpha/beta hydrolase [Mycolicibacterium sp. 050158]|uniref:alpha/beta hydrolase n=1 Tax=Mycolicibacterium sp. 050158 TaxID=3090602 RepID=UPI00299CE2B4|nr:alpha/beta hydrolase [Mycolicibacterium sp. 050158]MDX1889443.1 alpha/beta hydrolase [Mycolicibacterium sp. 050158]